MSPNAPPPRQVPGRAEGLFGDRTESNHTATLTRRPALERLADADARLDAVVNTVASAALGLVTVDDETLVALVTLVDAARRDLFAHRVDVAQR